MTREINEKKNVAMFLPNLDIGGAEKVFVTLSKQFAHIGLNVNFVLAEKRGALLDELDPSVNIIHLASMKPGDAKWYFALKTLINLIVFLRKSPPDVLISTLTGANLLVIAARILSLKRFRLVVREASVLANVKSALRLSLMRLLYTQADRVIALTETMKREVVETLRLPVSSITVIGNPVDVKRVKELANDSNIDIKSDIKHPFVLAIGRLAVPKDFYTIIKAIALINQYLSIRLVIIGDGSQREELQALSYSLDIQEYVHFLGYQTNPYFWLRQADAFVLSSHWEGFPNVLLEAMVLGCPIVATEYDSSLRQILFSYPSNYYHITNIGDSKSMADAIADLAKIDKSEICIESSINQRIFDSYLDVLDIRQ